MLCLQSYKLNCINYNKDIATSNLDNGQREPEIADVYGSLLDDLNDKYERLLALFQQTLANSQDSNDTYKKVSHDFTFLLRSINHCIKSGAVMVSKIILENR